MRIDYVITGLDIGGAEFQVVSLVEILARRGHEVRVISLTPPVAFLDRLYQAAVPVYSLGMRSKACLPLALFRLNKLLKISPPDIVHGHMVHANFMIRLARLFSPNLQVITTAHAIYEGGQFRDWMYRLTNHLSHINTTISEAATRRYTEQKIFPPQKTYTVLNGIDTNRFHPPQIFPKENNDYFVWLAVGRLVEQKDYPTLLSAFALLRHGRLLIAGDGPLRNKLQDLSEQLGLAGKVTFLGMRKDIAELYRRVDAFVLSSQSEGYGLVVAEAMASELPVVVTDSGGPGEIVGEDNQVGLVVPIKDPESLAKAMARIAALPTSARKAMGKAGRKRIVSKFSLEGIVSQWEQIYKKLNATK